MTEINTTIRPACETCRAGCQSNRRRFWVQVFQPGAQIDFDSESGHLLFIIGGEIEIVHAEGTDIGKQDEMVLLGYNREYRVMALSQVKLLVINFTTHYHVCDDIQAENVWKSIRSVKYQFNTLEMKPAMRRFAESVMYYLEQGASCNHLYDAKAIEISVIYRLFYPAEELARFFYPVLYKDLAFDTLVRRNYEHAKTVQELANLCGYSLPNFKKLFTKHFDVPPYRWMLQQKSAKIKNRLLDKTVPIKAIAAEFGFTDQSHLNAYCKQYFNATPLQIRNRYTDKSDQ